MSMTAAETTVLLNGSPRPQAAGSSLERLLAQVGAPARKGVAAAVNGEVVPRAGWAGRILAAGDRVIVVKATQGG
jgi:sulfur carrier protein